MPHECLVKPQGDSPAVQIALTNYIRKSCSDKVRPTQSPSSGSWVPVGLLMREKDSEFTMNP